MLGAGLLPLVLAVVGPLFFAEPTSGAPASIHSRMKRCSCNSWIDKECIYFCHLDIIWVNTGGQTISYGLGNPRRCKRKAPARCLCEDIKDSICVSFCYEPWKIVGNDHKDNEEILAQPNTFRNRKKSSLLREIASYKTILQNISTTYSKLLSDSKFWKRKR